MAVVLVAAAALVAGLWIGGAVKPSGPQPLELEQATVLAEQARPINSFSLIDHRGEGFDPSRLRGHWSVIFFGYTFCPDICPLTLSSVRQALERLSPGVRDKIKVVFVSVDPARDTPKRLSEYVTYFDPQFVGVTGSEDELARFARALGIVYARAKRTEGETDYLVDHSASMLVLSPDAKLYAVLSAPHEPALLTTNLQAIVERYDRS